MSRIGKQPIAIPAKVKVEVKGQKVLVEGPKGKLDWELPKRTSLKVDGGNIIVTQRRPCQRVKRCLDARSNIGGRLCLSTALGTLW